MGGDRRVLSSAARARGAGGGGKGERREQKGGGERETHLSLILERAVRPSRKQAHAQIYM